MLIKVSKRAFGSVAIVGSGNWGSAIARRVGLNMQLKKDMINCDKVKMWVFEEKVDGKRLTDIINKDHENVKYLPGIPLPKNVVASSDIIETCKDADVLMFVVPHQYLGGLLKQLKGNIKENAIGVSFIKGIHLTKEGPQLLSEMIRQELDIKNMAVVMGANVAHEVATDRFVETTVASLKPAIAKEVSEILHCPHFRTQLSGDVSSVELYGALKNIVAIAAGICDGLDLGPSTKAAVLRQGMQEMQLICRIFDVTNSFKFETMFTSSGVADVFATCTGGRNRKCSEIFTHRIQERLRDIRDPIPARAANDISTEGLEWLDQLWTDIECEALNGQKLQGVSTCKELMACLQHTGHLEEKPFKFPLFRRIYGIACQGRPLETLFEWDY